jgi:squalene-hopene/tetraprenyl-beta-curcumene cyclase
MNSSRLFGVLAAGLFSASTWAIDPAHQAAGEQIAQRAIEFLRAKQDERGGWSVPKAGTPQPHLPAITALALNAVLMQPGVKADDPLVTKAAAYILSFQKPDGGIYDTILPSYNTAISVSALARIDTPEARQAVAKAVQFLKQSQWGAESPVGVGGVRGKEAPRPTEPGHPNFGGLGYGNRGRPDLSNLAFALQAWHDAGLPKDDPAFQRSLAFLQRVQMLEKTASGKPVNDMPYARKSNQGGFIYATAENEQTTGQGQSFAGNIEETLDDGTKVSMLRAYGSVTYAGFKSYLFAGLAKNDERVTAAVDWARRNYTLTENPGIGTDGYYYYLVMFARAMHARGESTIETLGPSPLRTSVVLQGVPATVSDADLAAFLAPAGPNSGVVRVLDASTGKAAPAKPTDRVVVYFAKDEQAREAPAKLAGRALAGATPRISDQTPEGAERTARDWQNDLVDALARLQEPAGSFRTLDDRWMENNPELTTAYALLALQHALR